MTYAVLVLAVLCLTNLLLLAVLARRVRALGDDLRSRPVLQAPAVSEGVLPRGAVVPPFSVPDVDGAPVNRDGLTGPTLVFFLAPGCAPCEDLLPSLRDRARTHPGGRDRVLAVIVARGAEEAQRYVTLLGDVARMIVEVSGGPRPVVTAFAARAFPAVYLLDAGAQVLASGAGNMALSALPRVRVHAGA
jgi:thiol-disulfide isomerase/thioredoxin